MDFFDILVRYEIRLWNHLDRRLADEGAVSLARWQALRAVRFRGDAGRVQEISADLSITVGAASKLVDRLERDGLVERRPHPSDRRSMLLSLTGEGRTAFDATDALIASELEAIVGGVEGVGAAAVTLVRLDAAIDQASLNGAEVDA